MLFNNTTEIQLGHGKKRFIRTFFNTNVKISANSYIVKVSSSEIFQTRTSAIIFGTHIGLTFCVSSQAITR